MNGGTVTVTDWVPVTAGAVNGITSPLSRRMTELLGVMPVGTKIMALPFASSGTLAPVIDADPPGIPGSELTLPPPRSTLPQVIGLPDESCTETSSVDSGTVTFTV